MASISISASLQRARCAHHVTKKQQQSPPQRAVTLGVEGQSCFTPAEQPEEQHALWINGANDTRDRFNPGPESSGPKFSDERWKKGTWDLNMFVKNGRMDWDGVIVAEAKRRKFLEVYPAASTNQEPVLFRSSIVPWWAWLKRSYLPEAELLNGRAAVVGFFMSYVVDALTVLDVVGQSGNFICKEGLLVTVISVVVLRKSQDFQSLKKIAGEATPYGKQWQSSWEDQNKKL